MRLLTCLLAHKELTRCVGGCIKKKKKSSAGGDKRCASSFRLIIKAVENGLGPKIIDGASKMQHGADASRSLEKKKNLALSGRLPEVKEII